MDDSDRVSLMWLNQQVFGRVIAKGLDTNQNRMLDSESHGFFTKISDSKSRSQHQNIYLFMVV